MIAIQISLYPLEQGDIKKPLDIFWNILKKYNIDYKITPLSTIAWGNDEDKLYNIIFEAYKKARKAGPAVMVSTITIGDAERIKELLEFL